MYTKKRKIGTKNKRKIRNYSPKQKIKTKTKKHFQKGGNNSQKYLGQVDDFILDQIHLLYSDMEQITDTNYINDVLNKNSKRIISDFDSEMPVNLIYINTENINELYNSTNLTPIYGGNIHNAFLDNDDDDTISTQPVQKTPIKTILPSSISDNISNQFKPGISSLVFDTLFEELSKKNLNQNLNQNFNRNFNRNLIFKILFLSLQRTLTYFVTLSKNVAFPEITKYIGNRPNPKFSFNEVPYAKKYYEPPPPGLESAAIFTNIFPISAFNPNISTNIFPDRLYQINIDADQDRKQLVISKCIGITASICKKTHETNDDDPPKHYGICIYVAVLTIDFTADTVVMSIPQTK